MHADGIWQRLTSACEIAVPETVVRESRFHSKDLAGFSEPIDLWAQERAGTIAVLSGTAEDVLRVHGRFAGWFLELIQEGEIEALALLLFRDDLRADLCTGDGAAIQAAAMLGLGDKVVALEEVLRELGLSRALDHQFTREFAKKALREGASNLVRGFGIK